MLEVNLFDTQDIIKHLYNIPTFQHALLCPQECQDQIAQDYLRCFLYFVILQQFLNYVVSLTDN